MLDPIAVVLVALVIDMLVGDPPALYGRIAHPVVLIGRAIAAAEQRMNVADATPATAMLRGAILVIVAVSLALAIGVLVHHTLTAVPISDGLADLVEAALASTLLAYRSLYEHVRKVADALQDNLQAGRDAVAHIVGRDPQSLDEAGVARAAIESAAENFSDGVIAPLFWMLVLGLPGLLAYKTVNTLDSMIGHRTARYLYFGRIAARLDDVLNWAPARICACLLVLAALFTPGARSGQAARCALRDARKHRSPNAGWPEAAMAGAIGVALGGPRHYAEEHLDEPWIGPAQAGVQHAVHAAEVHDALRVYLIAGAVTTALLAAALAARMAA